MRFHQVYRIVLLYMLYKYMGFKHCSITRGAQDTQNVVVFAPKFHMSVADGSNELGWRGG